MLASNLVIFLSFDTSQFRFIAESPIALYHKRRTSRVALWQETIFNHEMNQNKSSTSITDFLKRFRNHLRIARAWITKKTTHETFVTLQNKTQNENTTDQKSKKIENRTIENRSCLCDKKHLFKNCYYLIEKIRSIEWKSNEEIKKKIIKILESNSRLRAAVKNAKEKAKWLKKDQKIENFDDESTQTSSEITLNVSFAETFVEEKNLIQANQLLNAE